MDNRRMTRLFHLTQPKNINNIQTHGLIASPKGEIFAFTDLLVAPDIALHQVFTVKYAVFRIHWRGIHGTVSPDDVAEFTAPYHRIIHQQTVRPRFLRLLGEFSAPTNGFTIFRRLVFQGMGLSREEINKMEDEMCERRREVNR